MTTAIIQLSIVEKCSNDKLIEIAFENGFDLNEYKNQKIIKFIW